MKAILWLPIVRYNGMDLDYPYGTVFVENRRYIQKIYKQKMNLGNRMQFLTKPWKSTRTWDSTGILGPTLTRRSPPTAPQIWDSKKNGDSCLNKADHIIHCTLHYTVSACN